MQDNQRNCLLHFLCWTCIL